MCFIIASLYLGCEHLKLKAAICSSHPRFLKELLKSGDEVHQLTEDTITVQRKNGNLESVIAEPLDHWPQYSTFSPKLAATSVLDCPRFTKDKAELEVHSMGFSCPPCAQASSPGRPTKRDNRPAKGFPLCKDKKEKQIWDHCFDKADRDAGVTATYCDDDGTRSPFVMYFLGKNAGEAIVESRNWKIFFSFLNLFSTGKKEPVLPVSRRMPPVMFSEMSSMATNPSISTRGMPLPGCPGIFTNGQVIKPDAPSSEQAKDEDSQSRVPDVGDEGK
jgi:hypothetical protein